MLVKIFETKIHLGRVDGIIALQDEDAVRVDCGRLGQDRFDLLDR
jgi:hypothetical protein